MDSTVNSLNVHCSDKAATIYRTGALNYTYVCSHCKCLFTNILEILDHIEAHFVDGNDSQLLEATGLLANTDVFQILPLTQSDDKDRVDATTDTTEDIISKCENGDEICVELQVEQCDIKLFLCDICESNFETKTKLSLHMREIHVAKHNVVKRGMYMCDQCKPSRNIQGKLSFYAHQYEHLMGGNSFDAVDDALLLDKLKTFLNTNILYDELAPEKAYGCKICCHLSVKRRKNIETHILQEHVYRLEGKKRSEKRYPCEYCGQKFTLSHNMIVHKRIHTHERPYTCLICNKSFSHSSYMKYHEKVHTGLCTHQCSTCGLSFKSKTKLNMHVKVHSTETTKCPICSKEFKPHRLNVHVKHVHQNEHRPYKCTVCLQAFKTAKTLKTHSYRHSGEKKYKCRFHCNERFTSTAGRRGHERSKHETH